MECLYDDTLIVSNFIDDSISIIDLIREKEVQKIKLCSGKQCSSSTQFGPHHFALDASSKFLYVPNNWHNSVSVVDLTNNKVIDTILVGSGPSQVVLCSKYKYIYVVNTDSNSLSVLNMDNLELIIQIPTGEMPHGMAITSDEERIFIGNYGSGEITEIKTKTNQKLKNHKLECNPWHLRLDCTGKFLFAVNYSQQFDRKGKVFIYETETLKEIKRINIGKMPVEAIGDINNKYLYITDSDLDCVHIYNIQNEIYEGYIEVNSMPHGIGLDNEKGLLFITSLRKNTVDIVDIFKRKVIKSILVGKEPTSIIKTSSNLI